ncbi:MAG: hypothetical protein K2J82_12195 [Muribaculaceae bacterium]|nr:hypothetical protein [Muribaculaceae bacterium]MDE6755354.1 hypothetical protein [Muribaculaceae bacterium]
MKLKTLSCGLLGVCCLLTSCEPETGEATQTVSYPILNLVAPADGGSPSATGGIYTFKFDYTKGTEAVTGAFAYNNSTYNFMTDDAKVEDLAASGSMGLFMGPVSGRVNQTRLLKDGKFFISSFPIPSGVEYVPNKEWIPYTKTSDGKTELHPGALYRPGYDIPPIVVAEYEVEGEFDVVTFSTDMSFFGNTVTTYPGGRYENDKMIYRVFINLKNTTADVVIYNAKFAEPAPALSMIYLPNLSLTLKNGDYEIEGTSIVPKVPEGTGKDEVLIDYANFTFNSFKLTTKSGTLMSEVSIDYQVATAFQGNFTGKYVNLPSKMTDN